MCGISAILAGRGMGSVELRARVSWMVEAQGHRGPDAHGVWSHDRVALGHNRLRVLDTSARADQPFTVAGEPDAPVLVYNGELYNFRALREELERHGRRFRTTSDTEALYHALGTWGADALEKLRGMFAFVYFDPRTGTLIAARDRLGIKPLHVSRVRAGLLFASECRGLLASGLVEPDLDRHAIHQVSRLNHPLGTRTGFAEISSVPPGTVLVGNVDGAIQERCYYRPSLAPVAEGRFVERARGLDEAFVRAVETHVHADVPVAVYLSGGLDSSGIVAEAVARARAPVAAYSMSFPGQPCDETQAIERFVAELGVEARLVPITETSFDEYARYVAHAAMPQLWTTDLSLMRLASVVRAGGQRVALSGEGPDELFAGYDTFRWMKLRRALAPLGVLRWLSRSPWVARLVGIGGWFQPDLSLLRLYAEAHDGAAREGLESRYGFYPEQLATWGMLRAGAPDLFDADFEAERPAFLEEEARSLATALRALRGPGATSPFRDNLLFEIGVRLPNWVLAMSDRMSAAHGIELRVPYLDDDFVERALRLPDDDRFRGLTGKRILREMHRGRVPARVRTGGKLPLYTPITEWVGSFFEDDRMRELLASAGDAMPGVFDARAVRRIAERVRLRRYGSMVEHLGTEWAFLLFLSTTILARDGQSLARGARARAIERVP